MFAPGASGNPHGRPKQDPMLRARCRELTEDLVERLHALALQADSDSASVAAIKLLLAYGHGAPESKRLDEEYERLGADEHFDPKDAKQLLTAIRAQRHSRDEADVDPET